MVLITSKPLNTQPPEASAATMRSTSTNDVKWDLCEEERGVAFPSFLSNRTRADSVRASTSTVIRSKATLYPRQGEPSRRLLVSSPYEARLFFSSATVNGALPPPLASQPTPLCEYRIDGVACVRGIIHLPAAEDLAPVRPLRPYRYIPVIRFIDRWLRVETPSFQSKAPMSGVDQGWLATGGR